MAFCFVLARRVHNSQNRWFPARAVAERLRAALPECGLVLCSIIRAPQKRALWGAGLALIPRNVAPGDPSAITAQLLVISTLPVVFSPFPMNWKWLSCAGEPRWGVVDDANAGIAALAAGLGRCEYVDLHPALEAALDEGGGAILHVPALLYFESYGKSLWSEQMEARESVD